MKIKYKNNFLKNVICVLDFPNLGEEFSNANLSNFQKGINSHFTAVEIQKGFSVTQQIDNGKPNSYSQEVQKWIFKSVCRKYLVSFEFNKLTIQAVKYSCFDDYKKIIELVVASLFNVFKDILTTRLGLRYINNFTVDGDNYFEWKDYINKNLLTNLNYDNNKKEMVRYLNQFEWLFEDDSRLRIQYGVANSNFPYKVNKKEFILDFDCFTLNTLDENNIIDKIIQFNTTIKEKFEKSIEEKLREEMGIVENDRN